MARKISPFLMFEGQAEDVRLRMRCVRHSRVCPCHRTLVLVTRFLE